MAFSKGVTQKLDENNRGHQLLKKMGWGGAGLGANEQGIAEPIKGGEVFFNHPTTTIIVVYVLVDLSNRSAIELTNSRGSALTSEIRLKISAKVKVRLSLRG